MNQQQQTIDAFVAAFNRNDLDAVMGFFSSDALYLPGDGSAHRGPRAIRAAFEPQFRGAYGRMHFEEHDRFEDLVARKMTIRWTCRHDLSAAKPAFGKLRVLHALLGLGMGRQFGWEGLDVFHFDEAGLICGKFSYANYPFPLVRRALGAARS
ncbi:MAG: nuclear transport factor 2 family protein [Myxococcales bacterium]